jgi:hypothetical protein
MSGTVLALLISNTNMKGDKIMETIKKDHSNLSEKFHRVAEKYPGLFAFITALVTAAVLFSFSRPV